MCFDDDLADLPGIVSVVPVLAPMVGGAAADALSARLMSTASDPASCRAFPSDALAPLAVDIARATYGVDGSGVTVGILSDSYAAATDAATDPAADVAMGLLPGPGNPCGYDTAVTVLADLPAGTGSDEGRAMAQLVHGIAPGAALMFHTGFAGDVGMAEGIVALAEAGADIIVDDISHFSEPHFQQGVISAAISHVKRSGVAYYTSAGNANVVGSEGTSRGRAIASWQTSEFRGMACPSWVQVPMAGVAWECLDFDPSGAGDATDTLFFDAPTSPRPVVSWAEPVYGLTTSLIPQLYVDGGSAPELVSVPTMLTAENPVSMAGLHPLHPTVEGEVDLVILRPVDPSVTASTPAVWTALWAGDDELAAREHDTSTGDDRVGLRSTGHAANGSAVGVAAVDWRTPDAPERFTSPGAGTMHFEPVSFGPDAQPVPSPAYAVPLEVPGPQIASLNGNRTSFFGQEVDGEVGQFFYGTSAAAPNAAAVHALALDYAPHATADAVAQAAFATAQPVRNPLASSVSDAEFFGAGLIDANALLRQLPPPAPAGMNATALSATSIAVEWAGVAGAAGYRVELLAGGNPVTSVDTDAVTTATTFGGLQSETAYTVRLAALGAGAPGAAVTADVTTLRPPVPVAPAAQPAASDLAPEPASGLAATPARVVAGEAVTVTGLPARSWVQGVLFSEPAVLGWDWTGIEGSAGFTVPASVSAGAHRLALQAEDGTLLGWVALEVTAPALVPVTPDLARTGSETDLAPMIVLGASALLAGAGLAITAGVRSRRAGR